MLGPAQQDEHDLWLRHCLEEVITILTDLIGEVVKILAKLPTTKRVISIGALDIDFG